MPLESVNVAIQELEDFETEKDNFDTAKVITNRYIFFEDGKNLDL